MLRLMLASIQKVCRFCFSSSVQLLYHCENDEYFWWILSFAEKKTNKTTNPVSLERSDIVGNQNENPDRRNENRIQKWNKLKRSKVKSCMGIWCGFYGKSMRIYFDFKGSTEAAKRAKEKRKKWMKIITFSETGSIATGQQMLNKSDEEREKNQSNDSAFRQPTAVTENINQKMPTNIQREETEKHNRNESTGILQKFTSIVGNQHHWHTPTHTQTHAHSPNDDDCTIRICVHCTAHCRVNSLNTHWHTQFELPHNWDGIKAPFIIEIVFVVSQAIHRLNHTHVSDHVISKPFFSPLTLQSPSAAQTSIQTQNMTNACFFFCWAWKTTIKRKQSHASPDIGSISVTNSLKCHHLHQPSIWRSNRQKKSKSKHRKSDICKHPMNNKILCQKKRKENRTIRTRCSKDATHHKSNRNSEEDTEKKEATPSKKGKRTSNRIAFVMITRSATLSKNTLDKMTNRICAFFLLFYPIPICIRVYVCPAHCDCISQWVYYVWFVQECIRMHGKRKRRGEREGERETGWEMAQTHSGTDQQLKSKPMPKHNRHNHQQQQQQIELINLRTK